MQTISAIIITKNEESNIADCIESVIWVNEIIVLDCGSTDRTQVICKKYAPKVKLYITGDWPGFGIQKNRAQALANSDWILSIDADERIAPALMKEILQIPNSNAYVAYKIPRINYFLGKPIKYGFFSYVADTPIRLAKKGFFKFSNDIIHEKIIVTGKTAKLKNQLTHFSFGNIEMLINKINNYSTLGAIKLYNTKKSKANFVKAFAHAFWTFIRIYFLKYGFLNGWRGFIIAFSNFEGTFYRYIKLIEKSL